MMTMDGPMRASPTPTIATQPLSDEDSDRGGARSRRRERKCRRDSHGDGSSTRVDRNDAGRGRGCVMRGRDGMESND